MKKHQKLIREEWLPPVRSKLQLQKLIMERLAQAGYVYVGMDHFARPDDEMVRAQREKTLYRNFQGYTTHKNCDLYAFGVSSISQTEDVFVQNHKNLRLYQEQASAGHLPIERGLRVTREDKLRRDVIAKLMCDLEVDKARFGQAWDIDFDAHFADALADLAPMQADGLVELSPSHVRVTELGRIFLRNIAMPFDAYLRKPAEGGQPRFSKTI
jgi:oxygen-independent coproporphyrinogen-3 oxidase